MKLLIATGLYPPDIGGPATYTVFLEKHMPRYDIRLTVVPYGTVRSYPRLIRHLAYTVALIRAAKDVDALYALDTVSVGLPVRIASAITRRPYLLRVPGDYAWEQGQQRFGITETLDEYLAHPREASFFVRALAWIQKHVACHALHIVVPSDYLKQVVSLWGVSPHKITRIYSALKTIEVPESKEALRDTLGYTAWTITTSARLVPWKGVQALISVTKKFIDNGIDARLEVIGDGVSKNDLVAHAAALGIADRVTFPGALPRPDMAARIKASDVFVLNTSYEGLSHQLIEVMSIGTPIVTTNVGGNPELIRHRETGMLVPYNDEAALYAAMDGYRTDRHIADACAARARERIALFHEDVVVEGLVSLIRSLWK